MYSIFFIHPFVDGHLSCFHALAIVFIVLFNERNHMQYFFLLCHWTESHTPCLFQTTIVHTQVPTHTRSHKLLVLAFTLNLGLVISWNKVLPVCSTLWLLSFVPSPLASKSYLPFLFISSTGKLWILCKAAKGIKGDPFVKQARTTLFFCVFVILCLKCYFLNVFENTKINKWKVNLFMCLYLLVIWDMICTTSYWQ